ncbi:hypothetical protein N7468_007405 [Penicillium chermesinum]|uniref:Nuclear RNA binding protein n=1 Tax=Penicillium chermesinum TaxID=63820 RepID=A0A9W9NUA2_9EURO|nr:uncharacterized protein N7468_007405 [Penicillium chermesinum]KAJ5226180.1 hypothetical protein N7468_007405 [Penicillium chermesinum]
MAACIKDRDLSNSILRETFQGPDHADMDIDPSPAQEPRSSRKHLRTSDEYDDAEWSSDVSGRFDDADEPEPEESKTPSAKSVKRRRSNDWPLPEEAADYGNADCRNGRNGHVNFGASQKSSPRTSATSLRSRNKVVALTNSPRHHRLGRRSRFVEASMSDSVSEKPPSILFQEGKPPGPQHRQSGIFRFGKAIASAFNPFGGWGRISPDSEQANKAESQKTALSQAEEAYAELKRAGYKGTNKGAYLQGQSVNPSNADQTWHAIQEKMGCGAAPHSPSKSNKRSSFQDLRRTASIGLPFMKHHEQQPAHNSSLCQDHPSEDSENAAPGLKKQKSRREISREAKLVRKVNTLEEKLDRARRELRELSGNEGKLLAPVPEPTCMSIEMDPGNYPRKFVPGALPTLPSERLLDQQTILPASPTADANQATVPSTVEDQRVPKDEYRQVTIDSAKSPKRRSKDPRPSSMGKESSSLKRKSPVPEHIASGIPVQPNQTDRLDKLTSESDHIVDTDLLTTPRQSKWQKFEAGDSPGAALPTTSLKPPSAGIDDSLDVKTIQSSSALRTQRRRSNLRPDSLAHVDSGPDLASELSIDFELSPPPQPSNAHQSFYLQSHRDLDPDRAPRSSPSKSRPGLNRRRSRDTNIPLSRLYPKNCSRVLPKLPGRPRREPILGKALHRVYYLRSL